MKKFFATVIPGMALLGAILASSPAKADRQQMQRLVPNVTRPRLTERTYVFSRSQLKYGLQKTDYLSRWVDQPLFVDPALKGDDNSGVAITYPSFVKMAEVARSYGLDGFAFFPETSGRYVAYDYARRSAIPEFHLLNELTSATGPMNKDDVVKLALACPQSLRINNKLVFTSYRADAKPPEFWQKLLAGFRHQYGDQFLFLPDIGQWAGKSMNDWRTKYHGNTVTAQDVLSIKEDLRKWARATDGLYYAAAASLQNDNHTFDGDFYQHFMIPIMKSVLVEPEFKQKYFGLSAVVGHENATRVGVTLSSDATRSFRASMDAALSAQPDIINIPEWDEQNENTSLRPTVYNGTSSMRLMRYCTAKLNGNTPTPIPDDDVGLPNLILSYRKLLTVGEELKIELLNVPDSMTNVPYTVRLLLQNVDGKTVYTSAIQEFSTGRMQDRTLTIPSVSLAANEVLLPRLEIQSGERTVPFQDGFHYINLRTTWNWDYKWVKQPIRDLMLAENVKFQVRNDASTNSRIVTAAFKTAERLARVQVLDNDDVIYEHSNDDKWRENADQVVLSFQWQSLQTKVAGLKLQGGITLQNAQGKWSPIGRSGTPQGEVNSGPTFSFGGLIAYSWPQRVFLSIPRAQVGEAALQIKIPGIYDGTIPVRQILDDSVYGIPGPYSFNLVISRYVRQDSMKNLLQTSDVNFTVPILPDLPTSVLHLQATGISGRIYRSAPVVLAPVVQNQQEITVYSDTRNEPTSVQVSAARVPDIRYDFNPRYGSVLMTNAGRPFWGVLGGFSGLATARGGGESGDATPFIRFENDYPANVPQSTPAWVKTDDGKDALRFDGKGTYIALPQGVIPRRAAFTIEMDIKPDNASGNRLIIANRHYYPGSIYVYTENGVLKADYTGPNSSKKGLDSGLTLPGEKWSHLVVGYDQMNITFAVDGKNGKSWPAKGPGLYDTASVVGGFGTDWFKGEIRSLRISHGTAK